MRITLLTIGFLFLVALELLRVYYIMPFPGSQYSNNINTAYFINSNIWLLRGAGAAIIIMPLLYFLRKGKVGPKVAVSITLLLYAGILYYCNVKLAADHIFGLPKEKVFAPVVLTNSNAYQPVMGVVVNGQAKAYPVGLAAYHHQIPDTVGGQPVLITFCTICREGSVFSPIAGGRYLTFTLKGMYHNNAMFEDTETKSWWMQATGKAITGPLKGSLLPAMPFEQMPLRNWVLLHPNSLVMQPDPNYYQEYYDFSHNKLKIF